MFIFYFSFTCQTNSKHVYVKPYTKSDGTQVEGHYRTAPNNTNSDNFSTQGNSNPYTGQPGWIPSDNKTPNYNNYSFPNANYSSSPNSYSTSNYTNSNYSNEVINKYEGRTNALGEKVITYKNGQEVFGLCKVCDDLVFNENREYWWYSPYSGVQSTIGENGGTLLHGEYKFYNENGKLIQKAHYFKGLKHGSFTLWSEEDGSIKERAHYLNGKLDYLKFKNDDGYTIEWTGDIFKKGSVKKVYSSGGVLEEKNEYFEDFKSKFTSYYPSGKPSLIFTTSIGNLYYGPYTEFYENGKIKFQAHFNESAFETGEWKWFKKDGSLDFIRRYKYFEDKYSNGQIREKGSYVFYGDEWVKSGKWYSYNEQADLVETFEFDFGKIVEKDK